MAATKEQSIAMATCTLVADLVADFVTACQSARNKDNSIVWDHLEMEGGGQGHALAPTVGSMVERYVRRATSVFGHRSDPSRKLLHNFRGHIKAGEMLMVIGRPGSGCTTFLKGLCHMHAEYKNISGTLLYGGVQANFEDPTAPVETTFCAEEDIHFPSLTVEETLRFAVNSRFSNAISSADAHSTVVNLARLFGIDHVLATRVGNEQIRGVSGGERRRVSLAEALVTCPDLICYDNPNAGLDSSTALEFVQMLREYAYQSHCTVAMSLYQGSDDMVPLFDKMAVINSGHCIYYGDVVAAKSYFEDLGFYCPPTMSITDFLDSMSAEPEARQLRQTTDSWSIPQTPEEFVTAFWKSEKGFRLGTQIEEAKNCANAAEKMLGRRKKSRQTYSIPILGQILLCAYRQYRIFITDYNAWIVKSACMVVQSIILGTVFRNLPHETSSLYQLGSVVFYAIFVPGLQSMSSITRCRMDMARSCQILYGKWWSLRTIFLCISWPDSHRTADHFFFFFLVAYISHLSLSMFFRFIAVLSPTVERAGLPVGIFLTTLVIYTGWYIPPPQMQVWLEWSRWNYCLRMHFIRLSSSWPNLCTIHQPAAAVIEVFDNLILLAKGGRVTYQGPLGEHSSTVLKYFGQHVEACDPKRNPGEYLLDVVGAGSRSNVTANWAQIWSGSRECRVQDAKLRDLKILHPDEQSRPQLYATPLTHQFAVVLRRTWLWYWREPEYFSAKLWMNVANGLLNGLTFLNIPNSQQGAFNRVYTIFLSFLMGPPLGLSMEPRFTTFRDIFVYREKASRSYHWIVFVMTGLQTDPTHAGYALLCYWLFSIFTVSLGYLIAAWMPNLNASLMANGFFFMFVNTFAGTLTAREKTPSGWSWYFNVSPLYYLAEGLTTNSLYGHDIRCTSSEVTVFHVLANETCISYAGSFLQSATGYLYQQFGYDNNRKYRDIGIFIGFIAFNFTAVTVGTYVTKIYKWKRKTE
ncbi:unnamed protein product [Penicillium nalgiovense]|nr:unnamed protein product [Penicillium nalgiovense]